jgi:hypothetical protein
LIVVGNEKHFSHKPEYATPFKKCTGGFNANSKFDYTVKKRLSKIARELNASISDVADFVQMASDCDEDPNESFSDEIVEVIRKQFPCLYIREAKGVSKAISKIK